MVLSTDNERKKKAQTKMYIILGSIAYVYIACAILQYIAITNNNKRISASEAINMALGYVFTKPLNVFPVSLQTLGYLCAITVLVGVFAVFFITDKLAHKADNPDTVNGEAHLMTVDELNAYNKQFTAPLGKPQTDGWNNMILSKEIRLAIDNFGTKRNCNVLVIGGSGAGKSRFFAAPNILQFNANFVITDPSGELLEDYGKVLENNGYNVKVFNLTDVYKSCRYNPFHYIKREKDVFVLVNTLIKNTNPSDGHGGDPFWEKSENLLLTALILYLWHMFPEKDQTFTNVLKLLNEASVDENDASAESHLDQLFDELKKKDPHNLAVRQYAKFKQGAGKTLKGILISVGVRLQSFDLSDIEYLTSEDTLDLESFSDTRQALFVITPTADTTFSFLVSLLYSQMFATLYEYAETTSKYGWALSAGHETLLVKQAKNDAESQEAKKYINAIQNEIKSSGVEIGYFDGDKFISGKKDPTNNTYKLYTKKSKILLGWRGDKKALAEFANTLDHTTVSQCKRKCRNHTRFILDEFANIGEIPDFDQKLSTMRKYEISCSIILQALSQLKVMYKDKWNTIVANCDTKLFLGCDDTETIEWMLKMLGKRTTTVKNTSEASGKTSGSTSYNKSSIELLTIDQISMMQDNECLVRIRGVRPYYGKKYNVGEHPNYQAAMDTKGQFIIPLAEGIEERMELDKPLRERKQNNSKIEERASSLEQSLETSNKGENKESSTQKKEKDINKVKNKARKAEAQKNQKNLTDDIDDSFIVDSMQQIVENLGITPNSTEKDIKESIETLFMLDDFPSDEELMYTMTN